MIRHVSSFIFRQNSFKNIPDLELKKNLKNCSLIWHRAFTAPLNKASYPYNE